MDIWLLAFVAVVLIAIRVACLCHRIREGFRDVGNLGIPIYVITLAERDHTRQRRASLLDRIRTNDPLTFVFGVDGHKVDVPVDCKLRRGEYGCFMSHVNAWRMIRDAGHDTALLLEDDCQIRLPEDTPAIQQLLREVPDDWEVLALSCPLAHNALHARVNSTFVQVFELYGAHSLLINRRALVRLEDKLAESFNPGCTTPWDLWVGRKFITYAPDSEHQLHHHSTDTEESDTRYQESFNEIRTTGSRFEGFSNFHPKHGTR